MIKGRVVDDTMTEQWPALHQSKHERFPLCCYLSYLAIGAERLPDDNTNNLLQSCRAKEVFFSGASIFAISDLPQVWKHAPRWSSPTPALDRPRWAALQNQKNPASVARFLRALRRARECRRELRNWGLPMSAGAEIGRASCRE